MDNEVSTERIHE